METVLVTGGAGFIGSHLVDRLIENNFKVVVIDNLSTGRIENLEKHRKNSNFAFIRDPINITLKDDLLRIYNFEYIYHLSAIPSVRLSYIDPINTHNTNVTDTILLLEFARTQKNLKKFILASSCSVYGDKKICNSNDKENPKSLYALSKYICEQYCKLYSSLFNVPTIYLRFFNVYGPRVRLDSEYSSVISKFLTQAIKKEPFTLIGDMNKSRDFIYIDDIIDALIYIPSVEHNFSFNVGTTKKTTLKELMIKISKLVNNNENYNIKEVKETEGEVFECIANDSIIVCRTSIEEGLKKTYEYIKNLI